MKKIRVAEEDLWEGTMGVCLACGETQGGTEPDAHGYRCESCGALEVMGLEQALLEDRITVVAEEDL
jgi:anaerobic ribonucleoside-triphosphate reductase